MNTVLLQKQEERPAEIGTVNRGIQLENITLSEGSISFRPDVSEYSIQVPAGTEKIRVKATLFESDSFYTVKGNNNLAAGDNDIVITVTDKEGNSGSYTIHVFAGEKQTAQSTSSAGVQAVSSDAVQTVQSEMPRESGIIRMEAEVFTDRVVSVVQTMTTGKYRLHTYGVLACGAMALLLWLILFVKRIRMKRRMRKARKARLEQKKQRTEQWELAQKQQDELLSQVDQLLEKRKRRANAGVVPESDYSEKYHEGTNGMEQTEQEYPEDDDFADEDSYDEDAYDLNEEELDRWLEGLNRKEANEDR